MKQKKIKAYQWSHSHALELFTHSDLKANSQGLWCPMVTFGKEKHMEGQKKEQTNWDPRCYPKTCNTLDFSITGHKPVHPHG